MGTCILCGEIVSSDSGAAWTITPAVRHGIGVQPTHWIHSGCIDQARAATMRPMQGVA